MDVEIKNVKMKIRKVILIFSTFSVVPENYGWLDCGSVSAS